MIILEKYTTYFTLPVDTRGYIKNTSVTAVPLVKPFYTYKQDFRSKRWMVDKIFVEHDRKREVLHFPVSLLSDVQRYLDNKHIKYKVEVKDAWKAGNHEFTMISQPRADQPKAIDFVVNKPTKVEIPLLSLQTGKGKTFCSIYIAHKLQKRMIIFVSGLLEHWCKDILNHTECTKDDIVVLSGENSIRNLYETIDDSCSPNFIIASHRTMQMFLESNDDTLPSWEEFMQKCDIGCAVIDEAHQYFHFTNKIWLYSNFEHAFALTATMTSGNNKVIKIMEKVYPKEYRFGEQDYNKYVKIFSYGYFLNGTHRCNAVGPHGYSHIKYEKWLLCDQDRQSKFFSSVLYSIIERHYVKIAEKGEKLLIIGDTKAMCQWLVDIVQASFPQYTTNLFVGGVPQSVLDESDIIVATIKKAGTGLDIKNLITGINTVSRKAKTDNIQNLGRLRNIKGRTPHYVYIYNRDLESHQFHNKHREALYSRLGKTLTLRSC